jgi:signal transduction histidine kinase
MDKVNILLVDDQHSKLLSYEAILGDMGENLVTARSGREALQLLLNKEFAVILLDVVMPDMDGFETAHLIRERPRLESTPIIFVTAISTSDLDRLKGYELGAVDFVFAPIVPVMLRAKVSAFVELFRQRQQLAVANQQLLAEIAERKRAQEQALQAERLAAIGQMVAGLAHESRNALQQIQASVEMLGRRIQSGMEVSLIAAIQKALDRLHQLLEEVRGYAAPLTLTYEVRDLPSLWREAWAQLAPLREGRETRLDEDTNGNDLRCVVDPFPVERLFRNILENSLAACADPVKIKIQCSDTALNGAPAFCIRVADNGVGFSTEQKNRIFEPFFTTKARGTGLGMAIAKRIVEAHGGRIAAKNGPDAGAVIEVLLPKGQV